MNFTFLITTINNYKYKNAIDEKSNYLKSQSINEMKSDKNYELCSALN